MARRVGIAVAALALATAAACGGGGGSDGEAAAEPEPLTVEDLKPSPDHSARSLDAPVQLDLPDESWSDLASVLKSSLSQIITASFTDPEVWAATTDEEAFERVYSEFGALGDRSGEFAAGMFSAAQDDEETDARIAPRAGSTFPADSQPEDAFIYKAKWQATEEDDTLTVRAVVWAGYDVGGDQPVLIGRELALQATPAGANVDYSASLPVWGGYYDVCAAATDGVLEPKAERFSDAELDAIRAEFDDPEFRSLGDAVRAFAAADGGSASSDETQERVTDCLAEAS